MVKRTLEEKVNGFLELFGCKELCAFLRDIVPLFELYAVDDENDWVTAEVGEENERNVRLLRTVYLMSRIAEHHAGRLCLITAQYKGLWRKMEASVTAVE